MHASNDDKCTIFNEEDAQRAHRVSELPGNNLHEKFKAARDIDEGKLVPIFLPKEIVSWFTERGIDYTQLTKDILESYRKAIH